MDADGHVNRCHLAGDRMEYSNITLSVGDRVATLCLNRPDALNALNP